MTACRYHCISGLDPFRTTLRKFLRVFCDQALLVPSGQSDPKTHKKHREDGQELIIKELTKMMTALVALEQDATITDSAMRMHRSTLVAKLVEDTSRARLPGMTLDDAVRRQALEVVLAPRRSLGFEKWNDFAKLLVRKLPGGKHFLAKEGYGGWSEYRDLYSRSTIHEADVVIYMLLIIVTQDNKLVQNFIGSPKTFKEFLAIFKHTCSLIVADKCAIDNLDTAEGSAQSDSFCELVSIAVENFISAHSRAGKDRHKEEEDESAAIEEEPELELVLDSDVINNLLSNL
jgi:hypothetical protein